MVRYQISRKSAEVLLGLASTLTILELTTIDDFILLMLELEEFITLPDCHSVEHLLRILGTEEYDEDDE